MLRSAALCGVAVAALASGCCWRPGCGGGPAMYNPPPSPLFPRLHPSNWVRPPVGPPVAGPDCPGCVGGLPPGAIPVGAYPVAGPVNVAPPPGLLAAGPQLSPMYFGPPPATPVVPPGTAQLPPPRAGDAPSVMPTK